MNSPTDDLDGDSPQCRAALERLAAELSPRDFATTLVTGYGRPPRLTVASRHTPLSEEISAARHAYRWSWTEPIAPLNDPCLAARRITRVLGGGLRLAHD
jgi:hypothetical protein